MLTNFIMHGWMHGKDRNRMSLAASSSRRQLLTYLLTKALLLSVQLVSTLSIDYARLVSKF